MLLSVTEQFVGTLCIEFLWFLHRNIYNPKETEFCCCYINLLCQHGLNEARFFSPCNQQKVQVWAACSISSWCSLSLGAHKWGTAHVPIRASIVPVPPAAVHRRAQRPARFAQAVACCLLAELWGRPSSKGFCPQKYAVTLRGKQQPLRKRCSVTHCQRKITAPSLKNLPPLKVGLEKPRKESEQKTRQPD